MAKFKKGQKVIRFIEWSERCDCVYEFFTVKSCGKERMTLEKEENEKMLKQFVYASRYGFVFLADDFATTEEIVKKGLEFSKMFLEKEITLRKSRLEQNPDASKQYVDFMKRKIGILLTTEPATMSYIEAHKKILDSIKEAQK